jgi:hypothetical protein
MGFVCFYGFGQGPVFLSGSHEEGNGAKDQRWRRRQASPQPPRGRKSIFNRLNLLRTWKGSESLFSCWFSSQPTMYQISTSHQPTNNNFLLKQTNTSHQPQPAEQSEG